MTESLEGRRVLITGAARGIGAATARRLHQRGARVALAGIEPEELEKVAAACGNAPWTECNVTDREEVDAAVESSVEALGGLDVVMANAGVAAGVPIVGGNPETFERTIAVNLLGVYYTLRAAGAHISHPNGYALAISSLAAAVHPPLLGAYSASKAAVEAMADAMRAEIRPSGAKVGVAYFGELDTEMTSRGFSTKAAKRLFAGVPIPQRVAPLEKGIAAIEAGIANRSRRVGAPGYVRALLPFRDIAQRVVERGVGDVSEALELAREEDAPLTTPQPDRD
jgi:NAD(P)-dependent dehydrogenase (short-subunit alcohol dehydrogenase family)